MSSSNCCFLICIQVSQEAGQVVWYSHLLQNFPQFIVIHTVEGFGIVNEAEIDVFLELLGRYKNYRDCFHFCFCNVYAFWLLVLTALIMWLFNKNLQSLKKKETQFKDTEGKKRQIKSKDTEKDISY